MSIKKQRLADYLFDDLSPLSEINGFTLDPSNYQPVRREFVETDDANRPLYSVEADPMTSTKDIGTFNHVPLTRNALPISIGVDASSVPSQNLMYGNTKYAMVKPFIICTRGSDAKFILDEILDGIKYLILISDKMPGAVENRVRAAYPHRSMQSTLANKYKYLKEGYMFAYILDSIVTKCINYGYKYNDNRDSDENIIIFKDGPILSNSEHIMSRPFNSGNFSGVEAYKELYDQIQNAANHGIPVMGVVKDSQADLLSKMFSPRPRSDYHLLKYLAAKQDAIYSFLPPVFKKMENCSELDIANYFAFLEKDISPLRLEVLSRMKPKTVRDFGNLVSATINSIYHRGIQSDFNGRRYKLPFPVMHSDLVSRDLVRLEKARIREALEQAVKRTGIPMIVKSGFE